MVFLLIGLVSLFADMTYEGARSVVGPYLRYLNAALVIAAAVSVGDLVSYTARLLGGLVSYTVRSSRGYWGLVFLGYTINLVAVPLLAFAGNWYLAFILVMVERAGKGLRAPARDAILAEVSRGIGRGLAYSIHEFLDQLGAVSGPLIVGLTLGMEGYGYTSAFLILAVPAVASLILLSAAYMLYPRLEAVRLPPRGLGLPSRFWILAFSSLAAMAGFIHWVHASYRLSGYGGEYIAYLYSLAMLVDAVVALVLGFLYDRVGRGVIAVVPVMAGLSTISMLYDYSPVYFALLWGAAMGGFQSVYRSIVADDLDPGVRGLGFGLLYFMMGVGWSVGNIVLSLTGNAYLQSAYTVVVEVVAVALLGLYLKSR